MSRPARPPRPGSGVRVVATLLVILMAGIAVATLLPRADVLGERIPAVALDAYRTASGRAGEVREGCRVNWRILAAISKVESDHGRVSGPRTISRDGVVSPPIRGPRLDGSAGRLAIPDTDRGRLDGDRQWDRAMGPLQFIPTTWRELGRDGNGDGIADPDNLYDASLTAVAHLCLREPGNYDRRRALRRALISYNASERYADDVLRWVDRYAYRSADELAMPTG